MNVGSQGAWSLSYVVGLVPRVSAALMGIVISILRSDMAKILLKPLRVKHLSIQLKIQVGFRGDNLLLSIPLSTSALGPF